jgi:chromosome segregation ATPase
MLRALVLLCLSTAAFAQTDTQLTQTLINEIRALRQDLQTTAATIQRIQIVMYRLQAQTAIINRATQRLDEARNRCTNAQNQHRMMASEMQRQQDHLRTVQNPVEQKQAEEMLGRLKSQMDMFANEEQQCQVRESDADTQYRAERAKMAELEDQLEKLDKVLAGVGK